MYKLFQDTSPCIHRIIKVITDAVVWNRTNNANFFKSNIVPLCFMLYKYNEYYIINIVYT